MRILFHFTKPFCWFLYSVFYYNLKAVSLEVIYSSTFYIFLQNNDSVLRVNFRIAPALIKLHYERQACWFFIISKPRLHAILLILQNLKKERFSAGEAEQFLLLHAKSVQTCPGQGWGHLRLMKWMACSQLNPKTEDREGRVIYSTSLKQTLCI